MSPDTLAQISAWWPYWLAGCLVVAGLVMVLVVYVLRAGSQAPPPAVVPGAAAPAGGSPPPPASTSLDASFSSSLGFLQRSTGGPDYRYRVPWTLVMGAPGSGISTLMAGSGPDLAQEGLRERPPSASGVEWRFLDQGVLLGVPGNFFFSDRGQPRDEHGWDRLLTLLLNKRPRRPLDGVVLAIPATDLTGPTALDEAELAARAAIFCDRLAQAQKTLGFTFPVYVMVTKCDEIPGFQAFAQELPASSRDQMFGWSSPYNLEAAFNADWVDEAFGVLGKDLQRLQSEIFVERPALTRPDEVFLFPESFGRLAEPLRLYLERLFRESAYREAFRFRGLYFCGDIAGATAMPPALVAPVAPGLRDWSLDDAPPAPVAAVPVVNRRAGFVRALFEYKVFPEGGIAQPVSKVFLTRNRMVLAIQLTSIVLALVLGLGTTLAYRRLSADRDRVVPMLQQMLRMPQTRESERHNLLLAMTPVGPVEFRSIFMPTSLFSGVDESITTAMTMACNQWVLTNLRSSLEKKMQSVFEKRTLQLDETEALARARSRKKAEPEEPEAAPNTSLEGLAEYRALAEYIADLKALKENRDIYEGLRQPGVADREGSIRKLAQYLYSAPLGDVAPNGHLDRALKAAHGDAFDISPESLERGSKLMERLVAGLFDQWFNNSLLLKDTATLKSRIGELEQSRSAGYEDLREALDAIKQLHSDLNNPGFLWVGSDKLDLTGPLRRVIAEPINSAKPFLRPEVLDYARSPGDEHVRMLRTRLADERTGMTGPVLDLKDGVSLSSGTRALELALENTMNLRFMSLTPTRTIRTTLDRSTRLIWRVEPLQEALRLQDIYNRFVSEGLRDAPERLRSVLARVALSRMNLNAQDLIAQAQDFQPRPLTKERAESEDETLPEVASFRDAVEPLVQLANRFRQLGLTDGQNRVIGISVLQAFNLLAILDRRLNEEDPYAAKEGNFGWWNGKGSVSLAAYEVRNPLELGEYLTTQRDRLKFLEQQAEPLVQFLNTWSPTRSEAQNRLVTRWQRIVADFRQYDGKKPGASLTALEEFILNEMDKITPETSCQAGAAAKDGRDPRQDYFQQIRSSLRKAIYERCLSLGSEAVYQTYTEIADLFNRTMAGNFPFAPLAPDKTQPEVTPEAIAEFYKLLDQTGKTARATLKESARFGVSRDRALQFLDQMEQLRPLVLPTGPEAEKEPPLTLDLVPAFRAFQAGESGGNQIIEWTLQAGGQIFRQHEPEHPGRWRNGNPIRLSLRWANDSPVLPVADSRQPNLRLGGRGVIFEYTNRWALFSFLRRHEAPASDIVKANDPKPYLLRFNVRTAPDPKWAGGTANRVDSSATVFMFFRVYTPGGKAALAIPPFPVRAPSLERPVAVKE